MIYPLVLEDKVWLIWASAGGIVKSTVVPVTAKELGQVVVAFRQLVQDPAASPKEIHATGQKLYRWLIGPLESELRTNRIQNLVFSLDRFTRYIPMGALSDGKRYLIEDYTISTVLSADLTRLDDRLTPGAQSNPVLALGASEFRTFTALPHVPAELAAIVRPPSSAQPSPPSKPELSPQPSPQPSQTTGIYPGQAFLNQDFSFRALRDNLLGHRILHIATHGSFVPGRPEDSFLVLGNDEKLTIPQIQTLQDLNQVHLVVLSACETALGGPDQDGVEISGISSYFLNGGASAVMASLWSVYDESTSQLMQQFYQRLSESKPQAPITKAQALRLAQVSFLYGQEVSRFSARTEAGASLSAKPWDESGDPLPFSHPYYWAPFILIGNGQ
jgi:CHAT domain-containing protein